MKPSTQSYKGARDFFPSDKRLQKWMFDKWRQVCERYGYEEYDASIIEPLDLYRLKNQTNEEIVNEQVYSFTDRGGREVALRPEMTPTVSRMVAAKRQELVYPVRWYSIPNLWRYERPQKGRLREHWQLNVDVFGIESVYAEAELICLADDLLKSCGAKSSMYLIKINSRALINFFTQDYLKLNEVQSKTLIQLIDRMHKMDSSAFKASLEAILSPSQRENGLYEKIMNFLETKTIEDISEDLRSHESVAKIKVLLERLKAAKIENAIFDPTLMRGFDYYNGVVFEVFDTSPENNRSMFGGGRYDGLVGMFGVEPVPTVGFGMGDVTFANFLEYHNLLPVLTSEVDLAVIVVGDVLDQAVKVATELREMGLNVSIDLDLKKPEKQLKNALKRSVKYVLFVGEKELQDRQFTLKNLDEMVEENHSLQRIVSIVKANN